MKNIYNAMRPGSRVMVHLRFSDGSIRGWGYDYPYYPTAEYLKQNIEEDFSVIPEHEEITITYNDHHTAIKAANGTELAQKTIDWLMTTGDYS